MGRSSIEQARQNRARIVEAASRLFRERGVEAVSVADIMATVEMTVGGFYKHFDSKEALAAEAADRAFVDAGAVWTRILGQGDLEPSALRARLVETYLRPDRQNHCPIIAFAPEASGRVRGDPLRDAYGTGTATLLDRFFKEPPDGEHAPDPGTADPEALLIFAAMIGARVISDAAGDGAWVTALKQAVVSAANRQAEQGRAS